MEELQSISRDFEKPGYEFDLKWPVIDPTGKDPFAL